jgi:hypothetical protein
MPVRRSEQRWINVEGAAGYDQTIDAIEIVLRLLGFMREQDRQSAGTPDRGDIVLPERVPGQLRIAARGL